MQCLATRQAPSPCLQGAFRGDWFGASRAEESTGHWHGTDAFCCRKTDVYKDWCSRHRVLAVVVKG